MSSKALTPSAGLLCKLGSIVVHADEFTSPQKHNVDRVAIRALLTDPEVKQWLMEMDKLALLPVRR